MLPNEYELMRVNYSEYDLTSFTSEGLYKILVCVLRPVSECIADSRNRISILARCLKDA